MIGFEKLIFFVLTTLFNTDRSSALFVCMVLVIHGYFALKLYKEMRGDEHVD